MTRILHVSANIFPNISSQHSTKRIWMELAKAFDEYHVLGRSDDNRFHTEREGNLYLHRIPKIGGSKGFFFSSFLMAFYIKKYRIDKVLCQCALLGGFAAVLYSKKYRIPVMLEIHDSIYFDILQKKRGIYGIVGGLLRYSYGHAAKVRVLNEDMLQQLRKFQIRANAVVIENRVDFDIFSVQKKDFALHHPIRLVSVGNFNWRKGYLEAIEAVKRMQQKYDISLTLIGGGKMKQDYFNSIQKRTGFQLYDYLPQKEFMKILVESDIYIQPSLREGMPRSLLEAMACRLPIVASDAGFTAGSVTDGTDALIFHAGDFKSFEEKLQIMIENDSLREKLAAQAYQDARGKFEWNAKFELYRNELLCMEYV